jgi:hypothetical protein
MPDFFPFTAIIANGSIPGRNERRKEIINIDSFEWQLSVKSTERSIQKYQITRAAGARTKNPKLATIPRHISYL